MAQRRQYGESMSVASSYYRWLCQLIIAFVIPMVAAGEVFAGKVELRHPGMYYDEETGLYYNGQRFYDPKIGQYTQPDRIGLAGGLNLYRYSEQNPVNKFDPDGRLVFVPLATAIVGGTLNLMITTIVNSGDISKHHALAAFVGGAFSGAAGAFAAPVIGTLIKNGARRAGGIIVLNGVGNASAQVISNRIDSCQVGSVGQAFAFGLVSGGVVGSIFKNFFRNKTMNTISQAVHFAPSTVTGFLLSPIGLSAAVSSSSITLSQNYFR